MAVWLVTGGTGFLGRHMLAELRECVGQPPPAGGLPQGDQIIALGRRCPPGWPAGAFLQADLDDPRALAEALAQVRPSVVLHAAGLTPPARPERLYRANTLATVHLLSALRSREETVRVVLAGSAAELGPVPVDGLPVNENHRPRPVEAYGLSKWFASAAGLRAAPPLEVICARVFNPIGPGLPASQAFGRFAQRLAAPGPDPLHLTAGDLDQKRDFIDVRDVARAFLALALRGRAGQVYHVGTGQSHRVGEGLERLIALSGRAVVVESNPWPRGPRDSRADIRRIIAHTGWEPVVSWEQSLADLWDEVRRQPLLPLTASPSPV